MSLSAEELLRVYEDALAHRAGLAAVLGRISQWAQDWETGMANSAGKQPFADGKAYCDGKRITFKYVADQLDALRSALMGEPQG